MSAFSPCTVYAATGKSPKEFPPDVSPVGKDLTTKFPNEPER